MKRIAPLLIFLFLLTLLPSRTALADDTSLGGQVTILLAREADATIITTVQVSNQATAKDSTGQTIAVTPNGIFNLKVSDSKGKATLPVALPVGETLDYFADEGTGLVVTTTTFYLPVKDSIGNLTASISGIIEPGGIQGAGVNTEVTAKNLILQSEKFTVDLTSVDKKIGKVTASFQTPLKALPQGASLKATVSQEPDKEAQAAFQLIFFDEGKKVKDIACTLNIERTNLDNGTDLGEATIIMKAGREWVEENGLDNIFIMHYNDEGVAEKLTTDFMGYETDDGQEIGVFQAVSPGGFSVFGLAAITERNKSSHWGLVLTSIVGSVLVTAFIIWIILRRRRRDSLVLVTWSTGMRRDDWKKW